MRKPREVEDLTGKRFGRIVILERAPGLDKSRGTVWYGLCDCGTVKAYRRRNLMTRNNTVSCGCHRIDIQRTRRLKHGHTNADGYRTKAYRVWQNMIARCFNPGNPRYKAYGGRGISVCEPWRDFRNFFADMGEPPTGLSIDRIDNDGNYEPGNCRWATVEQQMQNTRNAKARKLKETSP